MVAGGERGYVCVCNVHTVMASGEDPALRAALDSSSLNVPDGQPLVWAINALGHQLRDRVYGPELMSRACALAAQSGQRFYLYGGRNQGALVQLALNLRQRYPGVKIVGGYSPPHRPLTAEERAAVAAEINHARPDVVWVGIGVPKQEKWMAQMRPLLETPVLVGVGAAFDFHAGLVPQAPPVDAAGRARVGLSPDARATASVAALPALQPALRRRVRASADREAAADRAIIGRVPVTRLDDNARIEARRGDVVVCVRSDGASEDRLDACLASVEAHTPGDVAVIVADARPDL